MTMSNQELAKRADLVIADLQANGGMLDAEQSKVFIDKVLEQPTLLRQIRQVRMNAPERKVNKIGFDSRILRAARQGTTPYEKDNGTNDRYLPAAERSKPTTSQIELKTSEIMAEIRLPYETLEDNIEGANPSSLT